jgi:hypothetical protein
MKKENLRKICKEWIYAYLRSCSRDHASGFAKAEAHRELCILFVKSLTGKRKVNSLTPEYKKVHDHTQKLTGYMDTEIGFKIFTNPDYVELEPKFFERFYQLACEALDK